MPLAIKIQIHRASLKEADSILRAIPRAMPRVMMRAINRTVDMTATDLKRRVGQEITIKKSEIAKGINKNKASYSDLTGSVGAKAYRPGLIRFPGTREKKPHGVSYRISKTAGRKLIPHAFVAIMKTGHRGVFMRKGPARLPIVEIRGPSIWQVITDTPGLIRAATDTAGQRLSRHVDDYIGLELRKWNN